MTWHRAPPRPGAPPRATPHLRLLLGSHEQLLLADPRLGLAGIPVILLRLSGILQTPVPGGRLLPQRLPQPPQLLHSRLQLRPRLSPARRRLATAQHLGQAGGMAPQLLLQRLPAGWASQRGSRMGWWPQRGYLGWWVPPLHPDSPRSSWPGAARSGGRCRALSTAPGAASPAPTSAGESTH